MRVWRAAGHARRRTICADPERLIDRSSVALDRDAPVVYLISASWLMRHSQERLFQALRKPARSYPTLSDFLSFFDGRHGCICLDTEDLERPLSQSLELLRERTPQSPIIVLSDGMPSKRHDELTMNYTPLCVLTKPVETRKLLAAVDEMLPSIRPRRFGE